MVYREPIESMRDALELIQDLDDKIERLEEFLADVISQGMEYGKCRCGDWELWDKDEKDAINKYVEQLDEAY